MLIDVSQKQPRQNRASRRRASAVAGESARATHLLDAFATARALAREAREKNQVELARRTDQHAWAIVHDADPVRVSFVQAVLGVSNPTVRSWIDSGVLEGFDDSPQRVGLESVARTREILQDLRLAGKDHDLMAEVLSRLELEALQQDERFQSALAQMKRRERAS